MLQFLVELRANIANYLIKCLNKEGIIFKNFCNGSHLQLFALEKVKAG